jgi:uncharacterized membrane protein
MNSGKMECGKGEFFFGTILWAFIIAVFLVAVGMFAYEAGTVTKQTWEDYQKDVDYLMHTSGY